MVTTDTALAIRPEGALAVEGGINWGVMEEVLTKGNLSALSPQQRTVYYKQVCESVGLNPLTRPFQYIEFWQGKDAAKVGQLYATRNATDQLRKMHNINVEILDQRTEAGILTVHVRAAMGARTEEEIGSLFIGGLSGQELANAQMKAITKAKRRVTLAICGLSFMDETEAETLPRAQFLTEEEMSQREMAQAPRLIAHAEPPPPARASMHHLRALEGLEAQGFDFGGAIAGLGLERASDLTAEQAQALITQGRVAVRTQRQGGFTPREEATTVAPATFDDAKTLDARQEAWPHEPTAPEPEPATVSAHDLRRLWTTANNRGYSHEDVHALIVNLYPAATDAEGKVSSKALSPTAVQHLINVMESEPKATAGDYDERAGAKAIQDFWAHARGLGWKTQEVQDAAMAVWPQLVTPMGVIDATKITVAMLRELHRFVDGETALVRDPGSAYGSFQPLAPQGQQG